jgi:cytochrome b6-f complex iron-sulfur subunit
MDSQRNSDRVERSEGQSVSGRRRLLNWLWSGLGLLALVEMGWLTKSILGSRKKREARRLRATLIEAGTVTQFKPGTVSPIPAGQLYLARLADGSFIALSKSCTHLGCAIPWDEKEQKFICPCHGSTFDMKGNVLAPPATRPLEYYPVKIENELVKIELSAPLKRDTFDPSQTARG